MKKFEGKEVVATSVVIAGAGDGLSAALQIDPDEIHQGDVRYYLLKTHCEKVQFVPAGGSEKLLDRKHTMKTDEITTVPESMAEPTIAEARERIEEAQAEAAREEERKRGVERIPGVE